MIVRRLPAYVVAPLSAVEWSLRIGLLSARVALGAAALAVVFEGVAGVTSPLTTIAVVAVLLAMFGILSPYLWATRLFQPLGMWRSAWLAARLSYGPWSQHYVSGALVVAARTAMKSRDRQRAVLFLTTACRRLALVDGAAVVALAATALARGRTSEATKMFEGLFQLDSKAVPTTAEKSAREYLALRAAERGDWLAAASWSRGGARTRVTRFVAVLAAAHLGQEVRWGWVHLWLAPKRAAHRALLREAMAAGSRGAGRSHRRQPRVDIERATDALRQLVAARRVEVVDDATLEAMLTGLESLKSDRQFRDRARERARALGIGSFADQALAALMEEMNDVVVDLARESRLSLDELRGLGADGDQVAAFLRDSLLTDVESAFEALARRCAEERLLPAAEEWLDWLRCVELFAAAAERGGDEVRQLAWPVVHKKACEYGVWLHGQPKFKVLGNAVFRFLLAHAESLGDVSAIELQRSNVDVGY